MIATEILSSLRADMHAFIADCDALTGALSPGTLFRRAEMTASVNAPKARAWKARALQLNPEPLHNAVALAGMAPMRFKDSWMLAVAVPQPRYSTDPIDEVVVIDPRTGSAHVLGDHTTPVVAPRLHSDKLSVHTDAKAWARDIALHRLEWFRTRQTRRRLLQADATWSGDIPSALLLDKPAKVRWADLDASILDVPAELRGEVRKAVFAQARLPRVEGRA
ncbi:hypothetical protein [Sphingomonas sp.]|uniref:hypothetical protein n=1 Tax=Sphingomonas sp. TaxID=28214 RepID=UPI003F7310B1